MRLKGIYPALITPFKEGAVEYEVLRQIVRYTVQGGVDGVLVAGTTSETIYLSDEEWRKVVETVVDEARSGIRVLAGVLEASVDNAIRKIRYLEDIGVDLALVVSSYYLRLSERELYIFYDRVSSASGIPIVMYNIPRATGMYIPRTVIEDLSDKERIAALKDSSGNLAYMNEIIRFVGDKLSILCGFDELVLPALSIGADGAILGTANIIPHLWSRLYKAFMEGDMDTAIQIHSRISRLLRLIRNNGGPIAIKVCMKALGFDVGTTRMPLKIGGSLPLEIHEELLLEMERLGLVEERSAKLSFPDRKDMVKRATELGLIDDDGKGLYIGYGSHGDGKGMVSVLAILGKREGDFAYAWAKAYSILKGGYEAVLAVHEPGLIAKPPSLVIPYFKIRSMRQASIVHGVIQKAVSQAITEYSLDNFDEDRFDDYLAIFLVAVHPQAVERQEIYNNTLEALNRALRSPLEVV